MQDLHRDLAASLMHGFCHHGMVRDILLGCHHRRTGQHGAFEVGTDPAGHHQRNPATGTSGVEFRDAVPIAGLFQACVHGTHQDAVLQRGKAQIQRGQQMWVRSHDTLPANSFGGS